MQREITIKQSEPGRFDILFSIAVRSLNEKGLSEGHYKNMLQDALNAEYLSTMVDFSDALQWSIETEMKDGFIIAKFDASFPVRGMSLYTDNPEQDEISGFLLRAAKVLQKLQDRFYDPPTEQKIRSRLELIKV